jgi:hypothetical protein
LYHQSTLTEEFREYFTINGDAHTYDTKSTDDIYRTSCRSSIGLRCLKTKAGSL